MKSVNCIPLITEHQKLAFTNLKPKRHQQSEHALTVTLCIRFQFADHGDEKITNNSTFLMSVEFSESRS